MVEEGQLDTDGSGHYFTTSPGEGLHIIHSVHTLTENGEHCEQSEGLFR